ncbi:unnamed protein product [Cuscuta europaea]|uniref:E3 ubiquitin-protein ligase RMA n=1 Tax=Cuscuta europaea TaxID=41803 RepID=A0A9P0ZXA1_CUSEU|nr:unnamed protein product [Cuscuta europaea]
MITEIATGGCFDCNICLESAHDPVVTLCGHLYCWPCIYKWLHIEAPVPQCPVCKACISHSTLVPLYGRGSSSSDITESTKLEVDLSIPQRPRAIGTNVPPPNLHPHQHLQPLLPPPFHALGGYASVGPSTEVAGFFSPNGGVFIGSTDTTVFSYPSMSAVGGGTPRVRRQEMQVEKSLNRVSIFLLCCLILCLLLF